MGGKIQKQQQLWRQPQQQKIERETQRERREKHIINTGEEKFGVLEPLSMRQVDKKRTRNKKKRARRTK